MTTRWAVERAIMRTNIRPLGRLLVLTLLAKSDNETAIIPDEFTPSLSTLVAATGLARSAVAEHLKYLEDLGWVKRSMPARKSKYDRTHYALFVGRDDPSRPSSPPCEPVVGRAVREEDHSSSPPQGPAVVRTEDYSTDDTDREDDVSAGNEQSATRTTESSSPPHGHASTKDLSTKGTTKKRAPRKRAAPKPNLGEETEGQRVNRLAKVFTDRVPLSKFLAVAQVVRVAVKAGVSDELITKGLNALADDNRTPTVDALRYAIYGVPPSQFARAKPNQPYQNPENPDDYDQWKVRK